MTAFGAKENSTMKCLLMALIGATCLAASANADPRQDVGLFIGRSYVCSHRPSAEAQKDAACGALDQDKAALMRRYQGQPDILRAIMQPEKVKRVGYVGILRPDAAVTDEASCRDSKQVVAACFAVQGRLSQSNGNPSFRIGITGTNRILGVLDANGHDERDAAIPANIQKLGGRYLDKPVSGFYQVCPLTKARPAQMQMVCIESGNRLRTEGTR
jgi:hypothetical protein